MRPPATTLTALRKALGLDNQQSIIAYTGTLALQNHPVDLLLDAFTHIGSALPATVLLVIGGGEDLPLLRQRAHDVGLGSRTLFTGHLPLQCVPVYLALADVSVDPVHDNTVARARAPLKLFESLALGVPVVTGDVGDRAAFLDGGRAGVLVKPGNVDALAEALQSLLMDKVRLAALACAGQQHVQQYAWRSLARQWETIYEYGLILDKQCCECKKLCKSALSEINTGV
jgi:glycosyltransferase involved in cell wall biosynthesis